MLTCHYSDVGSVSDWLKFSLNHLEALPDLCSDTSSIWNFCTGSSDFILQRNQWWAHKKSAVFSGYGRGSQTKMEMANNIKCTRVCLIMSFVLFVASHHHKQ